MRSNEDNVYEVVRCPSAQRGCPKHYHHDVAGSRGPRLFHYGTPSLCPMEHNELRIGTHQPKATHGTLQAPDPSVQRHVAGTARRVGSGGICNLVHISLRVEQGTLQVFGPSEAKVCTC